MVILVVPADGGLWAVAALHVQSGDRMSNVFETLDEATEAALALSALYVLAQEGGE
jgi:hypothetical protein